MYTYAIKTRTSYGAKNNRGLQSDFTDLNDFNSTDDDGDTTNGDQHYKSVLYV